MVSLQEKCGFDFDEQGKEKRAMLKREKSNAEKRKEQCCWWQKNPIPNLNINTKKYHAITKTNFLAMFNVGAG